MLPVFAKASAVIPVLIADAVPFTSETIDSEVASLVTAFTFKFLVKSELPDAVIYFVAAASPCGFTTLDSYNSGLLMDSLDAKDKKSSCKAMALSDKSRKASCLHSILVVSCFAFVSLDCVPFVNCSINASRSKPEAIPPNPRMEVFPRLEEPDVELVDKPDMIHPLSL